MQTLLQSLRDRPVIAVVRRREDLSFAVAADVACIFLVAGDITTIKEDVALVRRRKKACFLHVDFITGLGADHAAVRYLAREIKPTGVVSIKMHLLQYARAEGLLTIQNLFLLDSQALQTGLQSAKQCQPNLVEVLPGIMPRVIREVVGLLPVPLIAGGLLETPAHVQAALAAGAIGAATSKKELWSASC